MMSRSLVSLLCLFVLCTAPAEAKCHYKLRHFFRVVTWYAAVPVIAALGGTQAVRLSIDGIHDQNLDEDEQWAPNE